MECCFLVKMSRIWAGISSSNLAYYRFLEDWVVFFLFWGRGGELDAKIVCSRTQHAFQNNLDWRHARWLRQCIMAINNSVTLHPYYFWDAVQKKLMPKCSEKKIIVEEDWVSKLNWRLSIYYRTSVVERCLKISRLGWYKGDI